MLSILLGHSYFLSFDRKQLERAKPYPPLATLQVAALLRGAGHEVALFDAMLASGTGEFRRKLAAVRPQLVLLYEDNFNFLSKMCLGRMRRAACEMIAIARRGGARVIAAGADVTDAPEPYLRSKVCCRDSRPAPRPHPARLPTASRASRSWTTVRSKP
jgi:anaerobic magnesium-protoporphyrin IX monomethyl ester cyclase